MQVAADGLRECLPVQGQGSGGKGEVELLHAQFSFAAEEQHGPGQQQGNAQKADGEGPAPELPADECCGGGQHDDGQGGPLPQPYGEDSAQYHRRTAYLQNKAVVLRIIKARGVIARRGRKHTDQRGDTCRQRDPAAPQAGVRQAAEGHFRRPAGTAERQQGTPELSADAQRHRACAGGENAGRQHIIELPERDAAQHLGSAQQSGGILDVLVGHGGQEQEEDKSYKEDSFSHG